MTLTAQHIKNELANSISHGFGLLFGIISIPILIGFSISQESISGIVGVSIYGFSFLMVYTFSTLYHSIKIPKVTEVLRTLDHISIYFLIAGSYTPFILIYFLTPAGITILSILWGLTLLGIVFKIFFTQKYNYLSTIIYLLMGWILVFAPESFLDNLPASSFILLCVGGGLYTLGVVFYLWEKLPYNHAIWHIFVLAASICHYVAILMSIITLQA
ncbi:PAQR family membrane homeostasis protein TrhA [Flexithrix dorotheae]|uniref:PAQR family membrane homeostasis protein TrhA n=1 Tax=Flexithrix dorotheae TaxID=70993 RepID=UPI00036BD7AC|nr:hemolysin III family protein [Flexithrix dorotheae]